MIFLKETWFLSMEIETFKFHLVKLQALGSIIMIWIIIVNVAASDWVVDFSLSHEMIIDTVTT